MQETHSESVSAPAANPAPVERTYRGADGAELAYLEYTAQAHRQELALVYLHGIESHAAWFDGPARLLCREGYDVLCPDRRGSGINRENRGFRSGHIDAYRALFDDLAAFIDQLGRRAKSVCLVGLSWGGKLAMGFALRRPECCQGLVLITPGIKSLVSFPTSTKLAIAAALVRQPTREFPIPIQPTMFTGTPQFLDYIRDDPLRLHGATARFFAESRRLERFIERHIARNRLPILLFLAGKDRIVDNAGVLKLLRRGGRFELSVIEYPDQTHSIQFDAPDRLVADMSRWLQRTAPAGQQSPTPE